VLCDCLQRDAWTRKHNTWRNQEEKRAQAERRWKLREQVQASQKMGEYLFNEEYQNNVSQMLAAAKYRPHKYAGTKKAKSAGDDDKDFLIDGLTEEASSDPSSVEDDGGGAEQGNEQEEWEEAQRARQARTL
jgi:hypothetical protein